ncbi:carboxypeptidase regulatory-like domain-containing protein [Citrobacter amalonaticus]|uniref:Carboxypeptidase regulatory-like domain-containing protein n=1 Tax=Citrobacter amalonaticus TaxID=35703 RepID=A0A2S4RTF3_CITAM|nr:carboxypeptidase-like regulatory domain-containing protein [Citrobacter amalonaticus]POT56770.1 carboxypeptidase regulatory-like domain-containing protein [Citrobacter amalonaticus]POT71985.1 carboxypeptidase regulatory-like domain-containing protein [Citrobacter amalonaticus]POU63124.1 carboxypeptidase regulatory-like domain-containing protein [Citrobacter amalonaticus]POV04662.1 carboxypeptidase regulatory-like domain-containing protein [Citrobacter amalonaticus]
MAKRTGAAVVLIALLQSGCVAYHQTQPAVEGRLTDNGGKPVQGAEITLESNAPSVSTVSDRDGFFSFPNKYEWTFFLPIGPMDWIYRSTLRISAEGKTYEARLGGRFGGVYAADGEAYRVICTLPDASHSAPDAGICHPSALEK